ncbi:MAG: hypothetical protein M1820_009050 [Bogoriella megaspora]|nr:MAG: hypothetical protein M1820_009050 [Bogoriella megaspora]
MSVSTKSSVTEIVSLPLIPGSDPKDPTSAAGKVLLDTWSTVSAQEGFVRLLWGTQVEDPTIVQGYIDHIQLTSAHLDWESLDKHATFQKSPEYQPFLTHLGSILSSEPNLLHYTFDQGSKPDVALNAPVVEYASAYLEPSASIEEFNQIARNLEKVFTEHAKGFHGATWGHSHEKREYQGGKVKVGLLLLGWDSVDAHLNFREHEEFKKALGPLRDFVKGLEAYHVSMNPL